jgi:thiol-disulfide isomerase/thioredoxin
MYSRIPMRSTSRFSKNGDFLNDLQKQKVVVVFVSMEGCPHCDAYAPKWNLLEKECSNKMPGVSLHRIPHTEYEPLEGMIQPDSFPHIEVIHPDPTSSFIPPIREMDVSMDREPETILTILRELSSKQSPKTQSKSTSKETSKSNTKTKKVLKKISKGKKQKGSSRKTLKQRFQLKQSKGSKRSYMSKIQTQKQTQKQEGKGIVDNLLTTFGLGRQQSLSQNQSQQLLLKVSNLSNQVLQRHNQLNESILNQYQSK